MDSRYKVYGPRLDGSTAIRCHNDQGSGAKWSQRIRGQQGRQHQSVEGATTTEHRRAQNAKSGFGRRDLKRVSHRELWLAPCLHERPLQPVQRHLRLCLPFILSPNVRRHRVQGLELGCRGSLPPGSKPNSTTTSKNQTNL